MTQTFDLNKMGLEPMSNMEMEVIDGGDFASGYSVGFAVGKAVLGFFAVVGAIAFFSA